MNMGQLDDTVRRMTTINRIDIQKDAPAQYRAYLRLDTSVAESALPRPIAELVRIRASQINGCAYCVEAHTRDALAAGETTSRLFAVAAWRESPLFDERER